MSHVNRHRLGSPRWHEEWLLSVTQALAMLAFSIFIRWLVL